MASELQRALPAPTAHRSPTDAVLRRAGIDPGAVNCNDRVLWIEGLNRKLRRVAGSLAQIWHAEPTQQQRQRAERLLKAQVVRVLLEQVRPQNFGAMRLAGHSYRDTYGRRQPLLVFRSAITTDPGTASSCLRTLVRYGHVAHVVNLYGGGLPLHDYLRHETRVARHLGVTHHDATSQRGNSPDWRVATRSETDYETNRAPAMQQVARLIRAQVLRPGNRAPRGNVYVHCAGGMHRSGVVFGVLRRCINREPMATIEAEYKRHTAYRSAEHPGGYEPLNLRFVREFDCSLLLERARAATSTPAF